MAAEKDNSGSLKLLIAFVGGGALITATVIALQGMYLQFEWNTDVQRSLAPTEFAKVKVQQREELEKYRAVPGEVKDPKVIPDPSYGIPIEKAMELVVAEYGAKNPAPKDDKGSKDTGEVKEKKADAKH